MTSTEDSNQLKYSDELRLYEELVPQLVQVSDSSGGIDTTTIGIEGTKIYTRLVLSAMTIGAILPNNSVNRSGLWDFPSVAILARSVIEAVHRYLYLIDPGISVEEKTFRRKLHFYRINCEKYRLFSEKDDAEILKEFEDKLPLAKAKIMESPIYLGLTKNVAKKVRSGNTDMHLLDAEVSRANDLINEHFGFFYRLLSNHSHGSPFATTSQSNTRGRGTKNDAESFYLGLTVRLLNRYLSKSLLSQVELLSLHKKCAHAVDKANCVLSRAEI